MTLPNDTFLKPSSCRISPSKIAQLRRERKRKGKYYFQLSLQLGILIPAGIPLPLKVNTSKEVKSGFRYLSVSNVEAHGSSGKKFSAPATNTPNLADMTLFTTATKPSNSPRMPAGSRYVSIKPIYLEKKNYSHKKLKLGSIKCKNLRFNNGSLILDPMTRPIFMII